MSAAPSDTLLWADKHRPLAFEKLSFNTDQAAMLKNLALGGDFPHLLFHGPSGAGKKTRVMCFLRAIFGPGVERLKITQKAFTVNNTSTKVEINLVSSNFYIEINPSECGNKDRFVVQAVLKEMASTQLLDTASQKGFKVIVIHETDSLSKLAQQGLRRTMEKYMSTCRIILLCNSPSQIIAPLRSRCLHVRVSAPTHTQVVNAIHDVCNKENIDCPTALAEKISSYSNRNMRKALLTLEACKVQSNPLQANQPLPEADWEVYIKETAAMILQEQTPKQLLQVRARIYELLVHYIPTDVIFKHLVVCFINKVRLVYMFILFFGF